MSSTALNPGSAAPASSTPGSAPVGPLGGAARALPAPVRVGLDRLRRRALLVALATGLVYLVAGVLAYHLASFVLDRALDLPRAFRAVLLGGAVVGLGVLAARSLVRPSRSAASLSDDEAALLVERHFRLDEGLISAVQLARPGDAHQVRSQALVDLVVQDAGRRVAGLDLGAAISAAGLVRLLGVTAAAVAVVVVLARNDPARAQIWWERNVRLLDTPWPRDVELAYEHEPASGVVALGDKLLVRARVVRGQPKRVLVRVEYQRSGDEAEVAARLLKDGTYRAEIENLPEPIRYRVEGGDFKGAWTPIDVRARPKLDGVRVWVDYPEYTGIDDTEAGEPLVDGNLKVPQGSVVSLEGGATEALRAAWLEHEVAGALVAADQGALEQPAPLEVEGRRVRARFRVAASTRYGIRLTSADGFDSGASAQFTITAVADRLPEVRVVKPGRNKDATPTAIVPIEVGLRDDYRLVEAALVYRIRRSGETAPGPETRVALPLAGPEREEDDLATATVETQLQLEQLRVEPDDAIEYWAEAIDARVASGQLADAGPDERGRTKSSFLIKVKSPADLERDLQARLKRLRDELQQVERAQVSLRAEVDLTGSRLTRSVEPDAADRRKLTYAELDQRKLGQRLERALAEIDSVREELTLNKLTREEDAGWLTEIHAITGQLIRGPVAEAAGLLGELRQAERPDAAMLARTLKLEDDIAEALRELVRRLDKWDLFNDVVRDFRDLKRLQERIRELTRRRMQQGSER